MFFNTNNDVFEKIKTFCKVEIAKTVTFINAGSYR